MAEQMIKTDEARAKFADMGLSYDVLDETKIRLLYKMVDEELKFFNKVDTFGMDLKRNQKLDIKVTNAGKFKHAFMFTDGGYFEKREAISFNSDGFISFAGWASSRNTQPFVKAFMRWCEIIGEQNEKR